MTDTPSTRPVEDSDGVLPIDVTAELQSSFLEYAYSVIVSRALPDARDGLKPVHRRIVFQMHRMGLAPGKGYVKSARVVGDVMGKLHPHGDMAIYDAMVRLAQPWEMGLVLVDGHGNFGSADDGPAASRYTEARLAPGAVELLDSIDEETVDMRPNYDEREMEPTVLPAAYPNLLVNGSAGIAVGMATNIPPHNLAEVINAARHLLEQPEATLDDLMQHVPAPDFPTGGSIIDSPGIRDAFTNGRGQIRMRATATIADVSARRKGIVITELPYGVGPEKITTAIKAQQDAKRLQGIARVVDLTDRKNGLKLVVEVKAGANPAAVLAELYKRTPLEESFNVNAVALVDNQPRTLGLKEMLQVYLDHRVAVVRRRCEHRKAKAEARAHIAEGLLIALSDIDQVVQILRSSRDTDTARTKLKKAFKLSDIQVQHILEMPLRRLTTLEVGKLKEELAELRGTIKALAAILSDPKKLTAVVSTELAEVAERHGVPRRTRIIGADTVAAEDIGPAEVEDVPTVVVLGSTGLIARTPAPGDHAAVAGRKRGRAKLDVAISAADARTRGHVGILTTAGRVHRIPALDIPAMPAGAETLKGFPRLSEIASLDAGESAVATVDVTGPELLIVTAGGVVKRMAGDWPTRGDVVDVIGLKDGDQVVAACTLPKDADGDVVIITSDAQVLRFEIGGLRPQGRSAGGVAGIKLAAGARVVAGGYAAKGCAAALVTVAGTSAGEPTSAKVTALSAYPHKGRGTGGVRCMRFLRGEDCLVNAAIVVDPAAATSAGDPVPLPEPTERRDASGTELTKPIAVIGASIAAVTP